MPAAVPAQPERGKTLPSRASRGERAAFLLMALLMLHYVWNGVTRIQLQSRRLARAEPVPAVITGTRSIEVPSRDLKRGPRYLPRVDFEFTHGGKRLRGQYPHPIEFKASREERDALLARFPEGEEVTAWVDPLEPEHAFLIPQGLFDPYTLVLLFGGASMVLLGVSWNRLSTARTCGVLFGLELALLAGVLAHFSRAGAWSSEAWSVSAVFCLLLLGLAWRGFSRPGTSALRPSGA